MKEVDIKRSKTEIDLLEILNGSKGVVSIDVDSSTTYIVTADIKQEVANSKVKICLNFTKQDIVGDILFRLVVRSSVKLQIEVVVKADKGMSGVQSSLDMRALLLNPSAQITFIPSLEISEKDVMIDHASTIGVPDRSELEYLESRGVVASQAIDLLAHSFLYNDVS